MALTAQQKKILMIFGLAMSALALCYALGRCYFNAKPLPPGPKVPPVPPLVRNPIRPSSNIDDSKVPAGYKWVRGSANAKRFMESEKNLSIIAALAKSSVNFISPLLGIDSYLYIGHLANYGSVEQIQAIVEAVADDRFKVRAIFSTLFWEMDNDPNHIDDWKQKVQTALRSLSHQQLMDILAIEKEGTYQLEEHEIARISISHFLKWQVDLNLPQDFIKACTELNEYAQFVKSEADKERARGCHIAFD